MAYPMRSVAAAALLAICAFPAARASGSHDSHGAAPQRIAGPAKPHFRQDVPPSTEQRLFGLTPDDRPRPDLADPGRAMKVQRADVTLANCKDMAKMATYSGAALAEYVATLPDYTCTYPLFSLSGSQAAAIYTPENVAALADRFVTEAANYDATNKQLVNVTLFLRAGYYLASQQVMGAMPAATKATLRPAIRSLIDGAMLYKVNGTARTTSGELFTMLTNMNDEGYFLPQLKDVIVRYTNSPANPNAADAIKVKEVANAVTGALTGIYYAHWRTDGIPVVTTDASYPQALYNFVTANKAALLGTSYEYELSDATREAFRFLQYPALKPVVKPLVKDVLAHSSMTGNDQRIWFEAAGSVEYFDSASCAEYGTCNYRDRLADTVLTKRYTCSPTIRIRAQAMTTDQMKQSCSLMQAEETLFHNFMQTGRKPVEGDNNVALEVVVFDNYTNYDKYAGLIYGIGTDNGGMYVEGNPSQAGNQARFIAHRASWLPDFSVWNLQHEYVHYLDGRFDMMGDFAAGTSKPSVWFIEGLAEYLSLKNNNQKAIDMARTDKYKLSTIFGNVYSMADYTNRAYYWGYMAVRFMFERHRADMDAIVDKFRVGAYDEYDQYMKNIGTRYDQEFLAWVHGDLPTTGDLKMPPPRPVTPPPPVPPVDDTPVVNYTACASTSQLANKCTIYKVNSTWATYAYVMLPAGAKNLKIWTGGGKGDADMYVALDRYPTATSYDVASVSAGNREKVEIPNPVTGHWYFIMLNARKAFTDLTISASWDEGSPGPSGRR